MFVFWKIFEAESWRFSRLNSWNLCILVAHLFVSQMTCKNSWREKKTIFPFHYSKLVFEFFFKIKIKITIIIIIIIKIILWLTNWMTYWMNDWMMMSIQFIWLHIAYMITTHTERTPTHAIYFVSVIFIIWRFTIWLLFFPTNQFEPKQQKKANQFVATFFFHSFHYFDILMTMVTSVWWLLRFFFVFPNQINQSIEFFLLSIIFFLLEKCQKRKTN